MLEPGALSIGHDCWIGYGAIVTPGCRRIGVGAIVAAGAVVTRDVADFAIVAGNPARELRRRFAPELCDRILASRWWEHSIAQVAAHLPAMLAPLTPANVSTHPLLGAVGGGRAS
jgi:carbonic anhydrase/acetyltransferase-like protein (isoleucine patch superfamily)